MSWRRPSKRSSRLALPSAASNSYSFSTASQGIRRRSAASASRARVNSFSLTSSSARAAADSSGDTIGGVFIADLLPVVVPGHCLPVSLTGADRRDLLGEASAEYRHECEEAQRTVGRARQRSQ